MCPAFSCLLAAWAGVNQAPDPEPMLRTLQWPGWPWHPRSSSRGFVGHWWSCLCHPKKGMWTPWQINEHVAAHKKNIQNHKLSQEKMIRILWFWFGQRSHVVVGHEFVPMLRFCITRPPKWPWISRKARHFFLRSALATKSSSMRLSSTAQNTRRRNWIYGVYGLDWSSMFLRVECEAMRSVTCKRVQFRSLVFVGSYHKRSHMQLLLFRWRKSIVGTRCCWSTSCQSISN